MTERNLKNSLKAILADLAFEGQLFQNTRMILMGESLLEEHASFSFNLGDFDAIWQEYLEH